MAERIQNCATLIITSRMSRVCQTAACPPEIRASFTFCLARDVVFSARELIASCLSSDCPDFSARARFKLDPIKRAWRRTVQNIARHHVEAPFMTRALKPPLPLLVIDRAGEMRAFLPVGEVLSIARANEDR